MSVIYPAFILGFLIEGLGFLIEGLKFLIEGLTSLNEGLESLSEGLIFQMESGNQWRIKIVDIL